MRKPSFLARSGRLAAALAMTAGLALAAPVAAKTLQYVVAFPAGGESDITARLQEPVLKKISGEDIVVQYRVGAGGATAWAGLNKMASDGSVVMGTNLPHLFLQPMQKDVGYKTEDIVNIYIFQQTPDAIVVPADSPYKTLQDLINDAKAKPGAVTLSGSGTFTGPHLSTATFNNLAGINTTYIPFSGTATSVAAMMGKQVNAAMTFTTAAIAQGDRVRMLAVALDERLPAFPDVPTFKELGFDMQSGVYRGVAVPKATPEDVRKQLSELFAKVNQDPDYRKKMTDAGFVVLDIDYPKVDAFMKQKGKEYEDAARSVGMIK